MLFRYFYTLFFLINQYFANSFELFGLMNGFKYLNDELNKINIPDSLLTNTRWIQQDLDHFDSREKRTWKMRYFERLNYWNSNGPIYLFLGGESPASPRWTYSGIMYELAKETHGAMYISEHRYYGDSKPLNGTNAETFKYLSAKQALADNAHLLKTLKRLRIYGKSKVVVIGGSYSGNLAAWMKRLYPELVDAAIASSGPVLAKTDFYEYLEKVHDNYEQYGTNTCINSITNIFARYDKLFQSSDGIKQLKSEEDICEECDMSLSENQQVFFSYKVGVFMSNSQYGTTEQINSHCKKIENKTPPTKESTKNCYCYDFEEMIEQFYEKENDWILAWVYQTCTEFGYFQTTSSDSQPFTANVPVDFYTRICLKLFGADFDEMRVEEGVREVNKFYGALQPNVTGVVFTNGDLDPWSTLSVLEDLSYDAPAVAIPRASHCRDLFSNKKDDIEELKEARKYVKFLIKKWIGVFTV